MEMNDKTKAVLAVAAMAGAGLPGIGRRKTSETAEQMLARAAKNEVIMVATQRKKKKGPSKCRRNKAKRGF
jgi:hypothetical protein